MTHSPEFLAAINAQTDELALKIHAQCAGVNLAIVFGALVQLTGAALELMHEGGPPEMFEGAARQLRALPDRVVENLRVEKSSRH